MKWFKHDSNANTDAKLRKLRIKYGMEGYGLYWYCLELIAQNVDKNNLTFELEHDAEIISHDTGIHVERVQEMMTSMVNLGLFENNNGAVTCLKMAIRLDETTSKNVQIKQLQDQIRINSRQSPDSLPTQSGDSPARIDKNRTEENRTEVTTLSGSTPDTHPPAKLNGHTNTARSLLAFLNEKTGRNYQPVKANLDMIVARLKEGATERQCRLVILRKFHDWGNDEKMTEYLRPATLFNRTKFAQYVGEIPKEQTNA